MLLVQTRGEEKLGGGQQKGGAGAQGAVEKGDISEKPHVRYTCSLSPFSFPLQRVERERGEDWGRVKGVQAPSCTPLPVAHLVGWRGAKAGPTENALSLKVS